MMQMTSKDQTSGLSLVVDLEIRKGVGCCERGKECQLGRMTDWKYRPELVTETGFCTGSFMWHRRATQSV